MNAPVTMLKIYRPISGPFNFDRVLWFIFKNVSRFIANMIIKKNEPTSFYSHEKKVPYPYYSPEPYYHYHHHCDIYADGHRHMMPHYFLPFLLVGSILFLTILTFGLLLVIDRARLTPVVRARLNPSHPNLISIEEILSKAIDKYTELNS